MHLTRTICIIIWIRLSKFVNQSRESNSHTGRSTDSDANRLKRPSIARESIRSLKVGNKLVNRHIGSRSTTMKSITILQNLTCSTLNPSKSNRSRNWPLLAVAMIGLDQSTRPESNSRVVRTKPDAPALESELVCHLITLKLRGLFIFMSGHQIINVKCNNTHRNYTTNLKPMTKKKSDNSKKNIKVTM